MLNKLRRKALRRRHKRILAAVAGAAVMSSAMLPGIPFATAHAASVDSTATNLPVTASQTTLSASQVDDPVQIVRNYASTFGFNSAGSYKLLSNNGTKAIVRVHSNGQTYKVDLSQRGNHWVVTTIRGIGDSKHPATYISTGIFSNRAIPTSYLYGQTTLVPTTLAANQQILFQTNNFNSWIWSAGAYPQDMGFGVLLQNPLLNGTSALVPVNVLNQINAIDFDRQFVIYAHLGTIAPQGYGIGIPHVTQTGNDLTVTIRTKSPRLNEALTATKTDAILALNRASIDFSRPIHITFIDQTGTILNTSSLIPR